MLLGLLAVWGASDVWADGVRAWTVCGGTNFTTCASVKIEVTGTELTMRVRNLSGWVGGPPYAILSGIGLDNMQGVLAYSGGSPAANADVDMTGSPYRGLAPPSDPWRVDNIKEFRSTGDNPDGSEWDYYDVAVFWDASKQGITSDCSAGPDTWCAGPNDGYVQIKFDLSATMDQAQLDAVELGLRAWNGEAQPEWVNTTCMGPECAVLPEPVTMLLIGTGLAGIGGAGLLRRRRRNGDVTNG